MSTHRQEFWWENNSVRGNKPPLDLTITAKSANFGRIRCACGIWFTRRSSSHRKCVEDCPGALSACCNSKTYGCRFLVEKGVEYGNVCKSCGQRCVINQRGPERDPEA